MEETSPKKGMKKSEMSDLPDAVLVLIISRLEYTEDAIQTSILSRRWRYLWAQIPSLDLDIGDAGESMKKKFKEFVYWVLLNRSVDLDCFRLSCSYFYSMSTVEQWIRAAVTRNVKQLDLTFSPKHSEEYEFEKMNVELPHCLVTCRSLEVLKLNFFASANGLKLPSTIGGFGALRVLHLQGLDLLEDDDLIKKFLETSCPLLEDLSLVDCYTYRLNLLCISCLKLKKLSIVNMCDNSEDGLLCGGIKICCPKLVDLELRGHIAYKLFFQCLDSLEKAVIEPKLEANKIYVLFPGISGVEYLSINLYFFIECINAASDPALPNLKTLVLKTTMEAFTMENFIRILKHYPKLESLMVMIEQGFCGSESKYKWLYEAETRRNWTPDVKRVEFFEFNGEKPKRVVRFDAESLEYIGEMVFTWGNEARFSC